MTDTKPSTFEELLDSFESNISGRATFGQSSDNRKIWQGWVDGARSALVSAYKELEANPRNEDERVLLEKYRGLSPENGLHLATARNGMFVSYPEWNRLQTELSKFRSRISELEANALTADEKQFITDGLLLHAPKWRIPDELAAKLRALSSKQQGEK